MHTVWLHQVLLVGLAAQLACGTVTTVFATRPAVATFGITVTDEALVYCGDVDILENSVTTIRKTICFDEAGSPVHIQLHGRLNLLHHGRRPHYWKATTAACPNCQLTHHSDGGLHHEAKDTYSPYLEHHQAQLSHASAGLETAEVSSPRQRSIPLAPLSQEGRRMTGIIRLKAKAARAKTCMRHGVGTMLGGLLLLVAAAPPVAAGPYDASSVCYAIGIYTACGASQFDPSSSSVSCRDRQALGTGVGANNATAGVSAIKMCTENMRRAMMSGSFPVAGASAREKVPCTVTQCKLYR
jgi:hypothetical protein